MGEEKFDNTEQDQIDKTQEQLSLSAVGADMESSAEQDPVEVQSEPNKIQDSSEQQSTAGNTHAAAKSDDKQDKYKKLKINPKLTGNQPRWAKVLSVTVGVFAVATLVVSGVLSQYYKNKTLPNVIVAGVDSGGKTPDQIKSQLNSQLEKFKLTLKIGDSKLEPKLTDLGTSIDVDKTVKKAMDAKRKSGLVTKLTFWKTESIDGVVKIDKDVLNRYVETNAPQLIKSPVDSQLKFDPNTQKFSISEQADGSGPNIVKLQKLLTATGATLTSQQLSVSTTTKKPNITTAKLEPLLEPANNLVNKNIVLVGEGFTFRATPADIASWVTPTPKNEEIKLVVDPAKIQSYVDSVGKKISSSPVDQKVLKDGSTGQEVILQAGRNGTELADGQVLANAIAEALKGQKDLTQTMNIQTAAFKTVNMNAYDKWIEVDLSEQRTTAYERATPIKNFLIASGMRGHETPVGEYAIWLRVRSQTMSGGSKADGSYYSIPNVEWVSYFYQDYALHGAWWREKFGAPASHGCVNMTNADAQWVYEWAPVGTKVIVHP